MSNAPDSSFKVILSRLLGKSKRKHVSKADRYWVEGESFANNLMDVNYSKIIADEKMPPNWSMAKKAEEEYKAKTTFRTLDMNHQKIEMKSIDLPSVNGFYLPRSNMFYRQQSKEIFTQDRDVVFRYVGDYAKRPSQPAPRIKERVANLEEINLSLMDDSFNDFRAINGDGAEGNFSRALKFPKHHHDLRAVDASELLVKSENQSNHSMRKNAAPSRIPTEIPIKPTTPYVVEHNGNSVTHDLRAINQSEWFMESESQSNLSIRRNEAPSRIPSEIPIKPTTSYVMEHNGKSVTHDLRAINQSEWFMESESQSNHSMRRNAAPLRIPSEIPIKPTPSYIVGHNGNSVTHDLRAINQSEWFMESESQSNHSMRRYAAPSRILSETPVNPIIPHKQKALNFIPVKPFDLAASSNGDLEDYENVKISQLENDGIVMSEHATENGKTIVKNMRDSYERSLHEELRNRTQITQRRRTKPWLPPGSSINVKPNTNNNLVVNDSKIEISTMNPNDITVEPNTDDNSPTFHENEKLFVQVDSRRTPGDSAIHLEEQHENLPKDAAPKNFQSKWHIAKKATEGVVVSKKDYTVTSSPLLAKEKSEQSDKVRGHTELLEVPVERDFESDADDKVASMYMPSNNMDNNSLFQKVSSKRSVQSRSSTGILNHIDLTDKTVASTTETKPTSIQEFGDDSVFDIEALSAEYTKASKETDTQHGVKVKEEIDEKENQDDTETLYGVAMDILTDEQEEPLGSSSLIDVKDKREKVVTRRTERILKTENTSGEEETIKNQPRKEKHGEKETARIKEIKDGSVAHSSSVTRRTKKKELRNKIKAEREKNVDEKSRSKGVVRAHMKSNDKTPDSVTRSNAASSGLNQQHAKRRRRKHEERVVNNTRESESKHKYVENWIQQKGDDRSKKKKSSRGEGTKRSDDRFEEEYLRRAAIKLRNGGKSSREGRQHTRNRDEEHRVQNQKQHRKKPETRNQSHLSYKDRHQSQEPHRKEGRTKKSQNDRKQRK